MKRRTTRNWWCVWTPDIAGSVRSSFLSTGVICSVLGLELWADVSARDRFQPVMLRGGASSSPQHFTILKGMSSSGPAGKSLGKSCDARENSGSAFSGSLNTPWYWWGRWLGCQTDPWVEVLRSRSSGSDLNGKKVRRVLLDGLPGSCILVVQFLPSVQLGGLGPRDFATKPVFWCSAFYLLLFKPVLIFVVAW